MSIVQLALDSIVCFGESFQSCHKAILAVHSTNGLYVGLTDNQQNRTTVTYIGMANALLR